MLKRKTKTTMALSALVVMGLIAGTYAYWNQTATIENPFDTGTYGTSVTENFTPEDGEDWQPGAEITKEVLVTNEGDQDLIVRVKIDETWTFSDDTTKTITSTEDTTGETDTMDIYETYQANATDGLTSADGSVVGKSIAANDTDNAGYWIDGEDGWYYYSENLVGGAATDIWLESVTLLYDLDIGSYSITKHVAINGDTTNWIEYTGTMPMYVVVIEGIDGADDTYAYYYSEDEANAAGIDLDETFVTNNKSVCEVDSDAKGYSDSDYVLKITVETVQATEEAVNAVFGTGTTEETYASGWTYYTED